MNSRQSQGKITAIYCRLSRDDDLAAVVRRIFRMVIDGKGVYQIADILSEEKVLCPSAYLAAKGVGNRRNSKFEDPYRRWGTTVSCILARVEYMGHTVNFKTFKSCYRDKISEAIMDRIIHNSYKIMVEGRVSMRERKGIRAASLKNDKTDA